MSRRNRYKIQIISAGKDTSYRHLIGKQYYLTVSQVKAYINKYYVTTSCEDAYLFNKTDVWLIDTKKPELSNSIYFPEDIRDYQKAKDLFEEIKKMDLFKEVWFLRSTHWASTGLWIEFGNEEKVKKAFQGYIIEHYVQKATIDHSLLFNEGKTI